MKFNYRFSNLCGSVYKGGNLLFSADGNTLLSPVGNRISVFDLVNHKCSTLPFENLKNIARLALSPDGGKLLSVDEDGRALFINLHQRVVLAEHHFQKPVRDLQFSPDGKFIAVTHGHQVQVWHAPALITQFRPFSLLRTYTGHYDDVLWVTWSHDSRFFVTGSCDRTARVHSLNPEKNFIPLTLTGHRDHVVAGFFGPDRSLGVDASSPESQDAVLYTVGRDGALFVWKFTEDLNARQTALRLQKKQDGTRKINPLHDTFKDKAAAGDESSDDEMEEAGAHLDTSLPKMARGKYTLSDKHYFKQNHAKVLSASLHHGKDSELLVVGFSSGVFGLYELPECNNIHTLSMSRKRITSVAINKSGDWLAFGCPRLGQLLVWEWQSETYVLKQQGHLYGLSVLDFSPDGQLIVTGGEDGKVKLWNTSNGFCFITFSDHTAPVTAVAFGGAGNVVFSASLDGTVRAYDLVRYRNFRTMTSPTPVQFTSLTVEPSGDIVCAGALDPFNVYVWSVQTGRLLDVLVGHEGPISGLAFNPTAALLASCSWDNTIRVWDVFSGKACIETFTHGTDVLALAFRPDGKELCTSSLDGQLSFWDVHNGVLKGSIQGRRDIRGGRRSDSLRAANNSSFGKAFTSLCYSADGTCILAGGDSKWVCIYEISQSMLLKRFQVSRNRSLDGITDLLNSKYVTEAGPTVDIDADDSDSDLEERLDKSLPGAKTGDHSSRTTKPIVRTTCVRFSPTGAQWAAAATEGLLIYSLDPTAQFDPFDLDMDITPDNLEIALQQRQFPTALLMGLRLNQEALLRQVIEHVPVDAIGLVLQTVPRQFLPAVMQFIALAIESSPHVEFYLLWASTLLTVHGTYLRNNSTNMLSSLRALQKSLAQQYKAMGAMCNENRYLLEYLAKGPESLAEPTSSDVQVRNGEGEGEGEGEREGEGETAEPAAKKPRVTAVLEVDADDDSDSDEDDDDDDEDEDEEMVAKAVVEAQEEDGEEEAAEDEEDADGDVQMGEAGDAAASKTKKKRKRKRRKKKKKSKTT